MTSGDKCFSSPKDTPYKVPCLWGFSKSGFHAPQRDQFPRDAACAFTTKGGDQGHADFTGGGFRRHALIVPDGGGHRVMLPRLAPGEGEAGAGERDAGGAVQGLSRA